MVQTTEAAKEAVVSILGAESDDPVVLILCVALAALIILTIILIVLINSVRVKANNLSRRLEAFMTGPDGASLEDAFADRFYRINELEERDEILADKIRDIYRRLRSAYQKTGLVKYDAYSEAGGKFSFALTMLDEKNNGFLLNVVNGRDGGYSFLKEISGGKPDSPLGEEEEQSLNMAMSENQPRSNREHKKFR